MCHGHRRFFLFIAGIMSTFGQIGPVYKPTLYYKWALGDENEQFVLFGVMENVLSEHQSVTLLILFFLGSSIQEAGGQTKNKTLGNMLEWLLLLHAAILFGWVCQCQCWAEGQSMRCRSWFMNNRVINCSINQTGELNRKLCFSTVMLNKAEQFPCSSKAHTGVMRWYTYLFIKTHFVRRHGWWFPISGPQAVPTIFMIMHHVITDMKRLLWHPCRAAQRWATHSWMSRGF